VIGVFRSNLTERLQERPQSRIGRPPLPDGALAQIKVLIGDLPTYRYRRVHAILKRQALAAGLKPANHKRIYRVMKAHGLLLDRYAGGVERRHDGRVAVDVSLTLAKWETVSSQLDCGRQWRGGCAGVGLSGTFRGLSHGGG
jgi:putative transposase